MTDKTLIGIASIPEREPALERVVNALAPQADRLVVTLNGYRSVPGFLGRHPHVEAFLADGLGGDAEKFAPVDDWHGYVLTCDDDVLYPPDYVRAVVAGIERHHRRRAVSFHGGTTAGFDGSPVAANEKRIRCLGQLAEDDTRVNVLGTGTLGWHTDHVPIWRDVFRHANMADVHLAVHARQLGIPMVCLAHEQGWLRDLHAGPGIYEANRDGDGTVRDTRELRERELSRVDWTERAPGRPAVHVAVATCSRPVKLLELLEDLDRESAWCDLEVCVYEDPSDSDYAEPRLFADLRGWRWHRFPRHLGRVEHWKLVDRQLRDARWSRSGWFLFLPDDVRLVRHAIPRAITTWQLLHRPATLTLWRLRSLEGLSNWTGRKPTAHEHGTETFHVDGLYLCRRETLETLGYRCPDTSRMRTPSSGVGAALSRRLHNAGRRMYRVDRSLVVSNDDGVSIMNSETRKRYPAVAL